jgi:hypothetical protein
VKIKSLQDFLAINSHRRTFDKSSILVKLKLKTLPGIIVRTSAKKRGTGQYLSRNGILAPGGRGKVIQLVLQ